jgi:hypothetical protein
VGLEPAVRQHPLAALDVPGEEIALVESDIGADVERKMPLPSRFKRPYLLQQVRLYRCAGRLAVGRRRRRDEVGRRPASIR